ncbi:MAG: 3-hydroxyacyl-CoA dehydrogenase/enoyl-CoA hydratase family protein [Syntrophobacteraceae bacterium]
MKQDKADAVLRDIVYTTDYDQLAGCQLVIEAATERLDLKREIFERLESIVSPETILTSNTSSLPAARIFSQMSRPERTAVTHFFGPAWRSLPVELIVWEKASQEVLDYLFWFFARTGKVPLIVKDAIEFMLDRVFDNWVNDAVYLLEMASASQIDTTAEEFVGGGPFYVLNLTNGNPITFEAKTLVMEEGPWNKPAPLFASVERWHTHRPGTKGAEPPAEIKAKVRDRLLGTLFCQSFDILDKGIGTRADLNFGCQIALGFKKGPLDMMRDMGEAEVKRIMDNYVKERPGFPKPKESFSFYQDFKRNILVDEMDGVKIITLRRPQALNALSDEVNNEILSVLKENADDPSVKGFVITGYGDRAFSAGADIGKFPATLGDHEAAVQYARDCAQVQRFMDRMEKPMVAAVNGLALGGGLEVAIRCHDIVATSNSSFQFPEITLGILPGLGGCVVPYRKWPKGAELFNEMLCFAKPLSAKQALEIGMIFKICDDYRSLIRSAVDRVLSLQGKIQRIPDGKVDIPEVKIPDEPMAGNLRLSREAVIITARTIQAAAAAETLAAGLEEGYQGSGVIACTEAAKEGISVFLGKRKAEFKK